MLSINWKRALQANGKVAAARTLGRVRDLKAGALNETAIRAFANGF